MTVAVLVFLLMLMFPPFALASVSAWMFVSPRLRMRPRLRRVRVLVLLLLACAAGAVGVESFWDASEHAGLLGEASFAVICVTFALSGVAASARVRDAERQATDDLARERLHSGERDRFGQSTTAPHV